MPRGAFSTNGRSEFSKRRSSSPLTKFEGFLSKTAVRQLERFPRDTARPIRAQLRPLPVAPPRPQPRPALQAAGGHVGTPPHQRLLGGQRGLSLPVSQPALAPEG